MHTAIKLRKYGASEEAFSFEEIDIQPPADGEVQIEVTSFGLNYADVMARHGLYGEAPPLPCVLGYEVVGKVIAIGKDAPKELMNRNIVAFTQFGGYSQKVNTKTYGVVPIDDYPPHKALCLATQYVTAYFMSHIATTLYENDNVLIHAAAGGVGTALIQLLKEKNVNIIAKTGRDSKFDYLRNQGVSTIINYNKVDYRQEITRLLGEKALDVSFNPVGGSTFKKDWKLLRNTGRLVLFGGSSLSKKWGVLSKIDFALKMGIIIPIGTMMQSKSLIGINMLKTALNKPKVLHHCLFNVVQLAKEGKLEPQVGAVFKAKEIAQAHDLLGSGKSTGKVVIDWE